MRTRLPWYTAVFAWLLTCNMLFCAHPLAIADPHATHHNQMHEHQHPCCTEKTKASADQCCQQDTQLQQNTPDVPLAHFNHLYVITSQLSSNWQTLHAVRQNTYPPPLFLSSQRLRI